MELPTTYVIMADAGPITVYNLGLAKSHFQTLINNSTPARVFKLEFDVGTNAFETASEITGDFLDRAA